MRFAEREKLDLLSVLLDGVVDELDNLIVADPAVRMKDEVHHALLEDSDVEGRLPVAHRREGTFFVVIMLSRPVARRDAGKFPAHSVDDVWIRIVLDRVNERPVGWHV